MTNFINIALAHTLESGEAGLSVAHHGFGMMGGYGYPMAFFGWICMLLFLTLLILAVVALVKYIKS